MAPGTRRPHHDSELTSCYHDAFLTWSQYHNNIVLFYHDSPITRSRFMDPTDGAIKGFYCTSHKLCTLFSLQRHHNEHNGISNHQPHDCLLNHLFMQRSKKTSKFHVTGLCVGNSPNEFPTQRASNAETVSIWWHHHVSIHMIDLPIFFKIASLAPGKSYDCPSNSEVSLKDMDKISLCLSTFKWESCA